MATQKREVLGFVGVDSGQIMIGDPCYLSDWKDTPFNDVRIYNLVVGGKVMDTLTYPIDFTNYEHIIPRYRKTMNELLRCDTFTFEEAKKQPSGDYSYQGACEATLTEAQGGEIGNGLAVCTSTGYGDGMYPVIATYNEDGRVAAVEIKFIPEEE